MFIFSATSLYFDLFWLNLFDINDFLYYMDSRGIIVCLKISEEFNTEIPPVQSANYLLDYIDWKEFGQPFKNKL